MTLPSPYTKDFHNMITDLPLGKTIKEKKIFLRHHVPKMQLLFTFLYFLKQKTRHLKRENMSAKILPIKVKKNRFHIPTPKSQTKDNSHIRQNFMKESRKNQ